MRWGGVVGICMLPIVAYAGADPHHSTDAHAAATPDAHAAATPDAHAATTVAKKAFDKDWQFLTPEEHQVAESLGYTQDTWDHDTSEIDGLWWFELTDQQRASLTQLGYDIESWNNEVLENSNNETEPKEKTFTQDQANQRTDSAVATTLIATMCFAVITFYMLQCKCGRVIGSDDGSVASLGWKWLGMVMSIFIAVNLFFVEVFGIEFVHMLAEKQGVEARHADGIAGVLSFLIANFWVLGMAIFFFIQDKLAQDGKIQNWRWWRTIIMPTTITVVSHIEGFALLHMQCYMQDTLNKKLCGGSSPSHGHGHDSDEHHRLLSAAEMPFEFGQMLSQFLDGSAPHRMLSSHGGPAIVGCQNSDVPLWVWTLLWWVLGTLLSYAMLSFYFLIIKHCVLYDDPDDPDVVNHCFHRNFHPDEDFVYADGKRLKFYIKHGGAYAKKEEKQEYESLTELWIEFRAEAIAISSSYCFMRILLAMIQDSYPVVYSVLPNKEGETRLWIWSAISTGVALLSIANWVYSSCSGHDAHDEEDESPRDLISQDSIKEMVEEHSESLALYFSMFLNMLTAWCWLQGIRWLVGLYVVPAMTELLGLILTASFMTLFCFLVMLPVALLRNYMSVQLGVKHEDLTFSDMPISYTADRSIADIIRLLSFVTAFMWELVVDKCLIGLAMAKPIYKGEREKSLALEFVLFAPLVGCMLIPAYCCWAYPKGGAHKDNPLPVGCCPDPEREQAPEVVYEGIGLVDSRTNSTPIVAVPFMEYQPTIYQSGQLIASTPRVIELAPKPAKVLN